MNPAPKPEPKGALEELQQAQLRFSELRARGMWTPLETVIVMYRGISNLERLDNTHLEAMAELAQLRSQLATLQAENERLTAEKAKLFEIIERNSVGNLRALYGEKVKVTKLETGSQPEKVPPTG